MDRLEQALEKSRQQRATLPNQPRAPHLVSAGQTSAYVAAAFDPALIDEAHMERHRIIAHHTRSPQADIYRQLRTQVLRIMQQSNLKTLAITSPHYGDGKSTVALNLGISIALDLKQTVLLADLDLRNPSLADYLGVQPHVGLSDYLIDDVPLQDCLMRPPFERVSLLPAGTKRDRSSELLGSPRMIALAHELKTRYPDRLIIYDMPPVLKQDDALAFLPQTDAVLVVVRDGVTRSEDLKFCLNRLSGAHVIGTVLNDCW